MCKNGLSLFIFATAIALGTMTSLTQASQGFRWGPIRVMTQNVFVGTDLGELKDATSIEEIPLLARDLLIDIQSTSFRDRAEAFAREVGREEPHLIGLQEMVLIRTQCPGDTAAPDGGRPAAEVYADYLEILMQALADQGLDYDVAAVIENADVESPAVAFYTDKQGNQQPVLADCTSGFPSPTQPFFDLRLTDRDVILARADVMTDNVLETNYATNLIVSTFAGPIEFTRGFAAVDASLHGKVYRFANTHLEVRGGGDPILAAIRTEQASELVEVLDSNAETLIVVGDFNSAEEDGPMVECALGPKLPAFACPTPYQVMNDAGFIDVWKERRGPKRRRDRATGDTCCQDKDLLNLVSGLDRRIDLIWVRTAQFNHWGPTVRGVRANTIGDAESDRTPDGLWYSDHAGVSARMTLPAPIEKPKRWWKR